MTAGTYAAHCALRPLSSKVGLVSNGMRCEANDVRPEASMHQKDSRNRSLLHSRASSKSNVKSKLGMGCGSSQASRSTCLYPRRKKKSLRRSRHEGAGTAVRIRATTGCSPGDFWRSSAKSARPSEGHRTPSPPMPSSSAAHCRIRSGPKMHSRRRGVGIITLMSSTSISSPSSMPTQKVRERWSPAHLTPRWHWTHSRKLGTLSRSLSLQSTARTVQSLASAPPSLATTLAPRMQPVEMSQPGGGSTASSKPA
mmetsp:Transcript_58529/g.174194  ORF Transcript_58529/g.174194 Transcript_58529/m.174194 type:complete len:254 (+) Transcript_58529:416-1177(+)